MSDIVELRRKWEQHIREMEATDAREISVQMEQLERDMCEIAARAIAEKDALRALLHGLLNGDPEAEREARALLYGPKQD